MDEIYKLWKQHRGSYPASAHIESLDLELLDADIAGILTTFIGSRDAKTSLTHEEVKILKQCLAELNNALPAIPDDAKEYFLRWRRLVVLVLRELE